MKSTVIFLGCLLIMASCGTIVSDWSILDQTTFSPLSWNNIILGMTSEEEMEEIISTTDYVIESSITHAGGGSIFDNRIYFDMSSPNNSRGLITVYTYIKNKNVVEMQFCGDINISIGDIVQITGNPQSVITLSYERGLLIGLLNSKIGIQYWYDMGKNQESEINENSNISCITYYDQNLYDDLLASSQFSQGFYSKEETLQIMTPWSGYGDIEEKYPFREP